MNVPGLPSETPLCSLLDLIALERKPDTLYEYVCFSEALPSLAGCSRSKAAQNIYFVWWEMRFAHFPPHKIHQASVAGANKPSR